MRGDIHRFFPDTFHPAQWESVLTTNPYLDAELRALYEGAPPPRVATPEDTTSERYGYRTSPVRIEVIDYMRTHGTGTTPQIAAATKRSESRVSRWLRHFHARGMVTVVKRPGIGPDLYTWRGAC